MILYDIFFKINRPALFNGGMLEAMNQGLPKYDYY